MSKVSKITFCGDDGDPIYAHDFVPIISYLKSIKPVEIVIVTNGSYKSDYFWSELGWLLDEKDQVHFSIDGYDNESNNLYRVNSDWDSTMQGIRCLRDNTSASLIWDSIAFEFNQNYIELMKLKASDLQMDHFQLTRSTKFGNVYPIYGPNDSLQPRPEYISSSHRFERKLYNLSGRALHKSKLALPLYKRALETYTGDILPLCAIGNKGLFINSQGHFFPCCWVANRYGHNAEWIERGKYFDLHKTLLKDVLNDVFWGNEFQQFSWLECQNKCKKSVIDENYATEW